MGQEVSGSLASCRRRGAGLRRTIPNRRADFRALKITQVRRGHAVCHGDMIGQPALQEFQQVGKHQAIAARFESANRGLQAFPSRVVLPLMPMEGRVTGRPQNPFLVGEMIVRVLHYAREQFRKAIVGCFERQSVL